MTNQEIKEWKSHPVTKRVIAEIYHSELESYKKIRSSGTIDEIAVSAVYTKGFIDGSKALIEFIDFLEVDSEED